MSPNSLNIYGTSKLAGEHAAKHLGTDAAILRLGLLFGESGSTSSCSISKLTEEIDRNRPLTVDNFARRYPIHVTDAALACAALVHNRLGGAQTTGIFQWCGPVGYTKYELAMLILRLAGADVTSVQPDNVPNKDIARPRDPRLDTSGMRGLCFRGNTELVQALKFQISNLKSQLKAGSESVF